MPNDDLEKFNSPYNPKETEGRIYRLWEESGFFNPDNLPVRQARLPDGRGKTFTVMIPPPNVTGSLHMGHALNATVQDIVVRKKRMEGYKTLWLPGTDHAGIATQNVVEKQLKKEGISRHDLGREKFLEHVWEWKEKYGNIILEQLKKLGASCDWSRTRFTMDDGYRKAVEEAFLHYHKKGWIYRGERIVNWCPRCGTSLSDLELEYSEEKGNLWHIRYPLKDGGHIVVATTRPETMLGDAAVAVNPKDKRHKNLIGQTVILPIQNREIPVVADAEIDMEFGTGAVKVTPAHDLLDFEIGERNNLPRFKIIDEKGRMIPAAAGEICVGPEGKLMKVLECREAVAKKLSGLGLLEKTEDYVHRVAKCYRCGTTVEPLLSKQWFLKMGELAKMAASAVEKGEVKFSDERWEKIYLDWLSNVRDWCVSRQIWWGHRLPIFFCRKKSEELKNEEEFFVASETKPEKCPFCGGCEMKQSDDVLDTWFSSALWPFATLGWPDKEAPDLKTFYPTRFLSTARDIINLWVARMVFSGLEFAGKAPFADVFVHPTVLAKSGQRMSKSLGTGIDPLGLIEKYGADAARFGLIYQMMGNQDIRFDESHLLAGKKFCNKIWNITRFVLRQNENSKLETQVLKSRLKSKNLSKEDEEILEKLEQTIVSVSENIEKFNFGPALRILYDFVWRDFADKYIEYSKSQNSESVKRILALILQDILKLLHPFMPFITEEIWQSLPSEGKKLLMIENWPEKTIDI